MLEKLHLTGGGIKILGTQGSEKLVGERIFFPSSRGVTDPGWHYDKRNPLIMTIIDGSIF